MTEKEASEKWCPMVRFIMTPQDNTWQNQAMTNRMEFVKQGLNETRCIGSDCMMWRWDVVGFRYGTGSEQERVGVKSNEHGYCGLGGKS